MSKCGPLPTRLLLFVLTVLISAQLKASPSAAQSYTSPSCDGIMVNLSFGKARCVKPGAADNFRDCPVCPVMVIIPSGTFTMGSKSGERGRSAVEGPQRQISIPSLFAVGTFEVTFNEWDACVEDGGCSHVPSDRGWGRGLRPVINVSWNHVVHQYLPWLSRKSGHKYRLLSEAEWEYASRAGTTTAFWWGDQPLSGNANCKGCDNRWGGKMSAPVGSFRANPFGLHDMNGNVFELVADCWNKSHSGASRIGAARKSGNCKRRVIRGGSWYTSAKWIRSAMRASDPAGYKNSNVGFRLARDLSPRRAVAQATGPASALFSADCHLGSAWHAGRNDAGGAYAYLKRCGDEVRANILGFTCAGPIGAAKASVALSPLSGSAPFRQIEFVVDGKRFRLPATVTNAGRNPTLDFEIGRKHPLLERLASGSRARLVIGGKTQTIHLTGSRQAIRTMLANCRHQSDELSLAASRTNNGQKVFRGTAEDALEPIRWRTADVGRIDRMTRPWTLTTRCYDYFAGRWISRPEFKWAIGKWGGCSAGLSTSAALKGCRKKYRYCRIFARSELPSSAPEHADCKVSRRSLATQAKQILVSMPKRRSLRLGEHVTLKWRWHRSTTKELIYIRMEGKADIFGDGFEHFSGRNSQDSIYAPSMRRPGLKISPDTRRIRLRGSIRIRPRNAGNFKISVSITSLSRSIAGKKCPPSDLTKTQEVEFKVHEPLAHLNTAKSCHFTKSGQQTVGPRIHVAPAFNGRGAVRTGDPLGINWQLESRIDPNCKNPLYLVFTAPRHTRFAGSGFFALAPGAKGPFGLAHDLKMTRIFVPLHIGRIARSGTLWVMSYKVGSVEIKATLMEVPRLAQHPRKRSDFDGGKPLISPVDGGVPIRIKVKAGSPQVVVQDRTTTTVPKKTIYANSGEFVLEIFDSYYRVMDTSSEELIIQRDGVRPNFSPSTRFVYALRENRAKVEIVDLYSRTVAHVFDSGYGRRDILSGSTIDTIAWGQSDSFVLVAPTENNGHLLNILTDRKPTVVVPPTYKSSVSSTVSLHLDLEELTLATMPQWSKKPTYYSVLEASGSSAKFQSRYHLVGSEWPRFSRMTRKWSLGSDMQIDYVSFCSSCPYLHGITNELNIARTFRSGFPIFFRNKERQRQWIEDSIEETKKLFPYMVRHNARQPKPIRRVAEVRSNDGSTARSVLWRGFARADENLTASIRGRALKRIQEFAQFDLIRNHEARTAGPIHPQDKPWSRETVIAKDRDRDLMLAVISHVNSPRYRSSIGKYHLKPGARHEDVGSYGCASTSPDFGNVVALSRVIGRTAWRIGDKRYWLVQQDCVRGTGIVGGQLGLMIQKGDNVPDFRPFHENLGVQSRKLANAWMSKDEILIVAAPNRSLLVYDARRKRQLALIKNAPNADIASEVYHTRDRSLLLQINTDGSIFLYRINTGERLLNGHFLDDEIVFYRDDGSYDATPEGAHLIHLKFPGVTGYHAFHQFERKLRVPNLVKKAIAGETIIQHNVGVPPLLAANIAATGHDRITGTIQTGTGDRVVQVQIFQDGVLSDTISDLARGGATDFDVTRLPSTRWVSAVAVSSSGLASQPVGLDLGPNTTGKGRIHLLSVGINRYDNTHLETLSYAQADARTIHTAIREAGSERFEVASHALLTDAEAGPVAILEQAQKVVESASAGETIVFFFAGHGVKDNDGQFYLATSETDPYDMANTALPWTKLADVLKRAPTRVLVFLDACNSGAAGTGFYATNDDAAAGLLENMPSGLVIFSASKGRELSREHPNVGGGIFTNAVADVIARDRRTHDRNENGVIEISELYYGVKKMVTRQTSGDQTPWLARNQMVGDFALF